MPDRTEDNTLDTIDTYLSVVALVLEARREDAFALISALEPHEQIDMWISGCSITGALATELAGRLSIPVEKVPAWLRAMAREDGTP